MSLTRNLSLGAKGEDVLLLQKILNLSPDTAVATEGSGSKGFETDYFGIKTREAVIRFQNKYSKTILVPNGIIYGNGFVGPSTRAVLNGFLTPVIKKQDPVKTIDKDKIPSISSISPEIFEDGGILTINGKNFTEHNNILISGEDPHKYENIKAVSGGVSIAFPFTSQVGERFRTELNINLAKISQQLHQIVINKVITGYRKDNNQTGSNGQTVLVPMTLRVQNENGTSTAYSFTINIFKNIQ